ncbi:MAG: hypothetical protein CMB64_02635 [Euryarchaeota archaeon]|nr:hypothetical protein [Euryarchaeota archaeon]|tara:strand:- start:661 stop:1101 length:441 start_codon:yes stop_codon:yes gene_type:complete
MVLNFERSKYLYYMTVETALDDNIITGDESQILSILGKSLYLDEKTQQDIINSLQEGKDLFDFNLDEVEKPGIGEFTAYQSALIAALDDEIITDDEWALLDILSELMAIQPNQHSMIEQSIKSRAMNLDEDEKLVKKLDRFLSRGL